MPVFEIKHIRFLVPIFIKFCVILTGIMYVLILNIARESHKVCISIGYAPLSLRKRRMIFRIMSLMKTAKFSLFWCDENIKSLQNDG